MMAKAQKPAAAPRGPSRPLPFSRPIDVRRLPDGGARHEIEATGTERASLAAAMSLPAVASLTARLELRRRAGGRVTVTGAVEAEVTQTCVVSLEPFDTRIRQDVDLVFAPVEPEPPAGRRRDEFEMTAMPRAVPGSDDQVDPPDPIIDDTIDLGVVVAEFLALALDPYPRKPGASFSDVVGSRDAAEPSPFAALESLKDRP